MRKYCLLNNICWPLLLERAIWCCSKIWVYTIKMFLYFAAFTVSTLNFFSLVNDTFNWLFKICSLSRFIIISHRRWLQSEDIILVKFLLDVIDCSHGVPFWMPHSICKEKSTGINMRFSTERSSSELQTVAFEMLGEAISRAGSSFPVDIWRSILEVYDNSAFHFVKLLVVGFFWTSLFWNRCSGKQWTSWH